MLKWKLLLISLFLFLIAGCSSTELNEVVINTNNGLNSSLEYINNTLHINLTYDEPEGYIGWIEYISNDFNDTNRLTIGTTLSNFSMTDYTIRQQELPYNITNSTWFNGTHVKTDKPGNSFIYRWRYKAEPQANNLYCEAFWNIGGGVGQLPMRLITFPKGIGIEQIGTFTNVEYTLNTWYENGALIQIVCNGDVEFWDIELTIERTYLGKGSY